MGAMPANSSVAAKKRSLNDTRRRTKERLLREQAQLGAADAAPLHEASSGLAKRMKLYAHMKNVRPAGVSPPAYAAAGGAVVVSAPPAAAAPAAQKATTRLPAPSSSSSSASTGAARSSGTASITVHRCVLYTEAAQRLTGLVEEVDAVRRAIGGGGGRRRAKVVILVKSKKAAEKLAPRLGWNGASAEMWTTEKTGRWGFGSIKRVRI